MQRVIRLCLPYHLTDTRMCFGRGALDWSAISICYLSIWRHYDAAAAITWCVCLWYVIMWQMTNPETICLTTRVSFKTKDGLKKPSIFCHSFYGFQIIFFKHWQTVTHKIDLYHSALMLSLHEKWSLRFPHMSSPAAKTSLDKAFLQGTQNDCYVLKFYRHSFKIII